jgi:hypothetical protein
MVQSSKGQSASVGHALLDDYLLASPWERKTSVQEHLQEFHCSHFLPLMYYTAGKVCAKGTSLWIAYVLLVLIHVLSLSKLSSSNKQPSFYPSLRYRYKLQGFHLSSPGSTGLRMPVLVVVVDAVSSPPLPQLDTAESGTPVPGHARSCLRMTLT